MRFGWSVDNSGTTAVVGAYRVEKGVSQVWGGAYLFDATTGEQLAIIDRGVQDNISLIDFGCSVATSDVTALIGEGSHEAVGSGYGHVFTQDGTDGNGNPIATAPVLTDINVALSGNTPLVRARGDDDKGSDSGSAYVFDVTTGQQTAKLVAEDGAMGDLFGNALDISGAVALVGAADDDDHGSRSGSAYLFDTRTGNQTGKLTADDAAGGARFGAWVSMSGDIAVIGAPGADDGKGAANVFDTTTGTQLSKLTAQDDIGSESFGGNLVPFRTLAVIGARWTPAPAHRAAGL